MKRIALGVMACAGLLVAGVTNVSAARYCSVDPTLQVGLPVHYSVDLNLAVASTSTHVYASGTSTTTTFGGGIGLP
jgi:hypothetical protein